NGGCPDLKGAAQEPSFGGSGGGNSDLLTNKSRHGALVLGWGWGRSAPRGVKWQPSRGGAPRGTPPSGGVRPGLLSISSWRLSNPDDAGVDQNKEPYLAHERGRALSSSSPPFGRSSAGGGEGVRNRTPGCGAGGPPSGQWAHSRTGCETPEDPGGANLFCNRTLRQHVFGVAPYCARPGGSEGVDQAP